MKAIKERNLDGVVVERTPQKFTIKNRRIYENGECLTSYEVYEVLCDQERKINSLRDFVNQSLLVWEIKRVINRRMDDATDESVKNELESLLKELI